MTKLPRILIPLLLICLAQCRSHEPNVKDIQGPPRMSEAVEKAPRVLWCDLIRNAGRHDKLIVRTHALLHADRENQFLYEPECESEVATPVWVEFDPSYIYSDEKVRGRLTELIRPTRSKSAGTAAVTIVGKFETGRGPYGHLNGYRSKFSIIRLEEADSAPSQTTLP
jgi:hypothetical protein